jgi:uncharacterized protein (DUF1697 family)
MSSRGSGSAAMKMIALTLRNWNTVLKIDEMLGKRE